MTNWNGWPRQPTLAWPPFRIAFDAARDPLSARNALGILGTGGGGGAPTTAEYITAAPDATLSAERVLTNTASITWDFSTPGQAKASTTAGGGNVSNSGTPTVGQYARWVTATTIQGVAPATVLSDIGAQPAGSYQPLDADLTAIAALTGTDTIYYRSAADTWSAVTISTGLAFSGGNLTATGGGGTPGGSNTQVQFNDSGAFGGDADLTWNKTTNLLTANGNVSITGATGNSLQAAGAIQGSLFRCAGTIAVFGTELTSGVVNIRPNTIANATGQLQVQSSGTIVVNGNIELGATDTTLSRVSAGVAAIEGQNILTTATGQPLDADLTAIAALTGTNTIYYRSAANTWSAVTIGGNMTFSGGTLNSVAGGSGNVSNSGTPTAGQIAQWTDATHIKGVDAGTIGLGPPQGRLTLLSNWPVMVTTQAAKTTLYYTPYVGNMVPIYDGTNFIMTSIGAEISVATTDTTKNPAAIGSSKINDWFIWNDSGTIRLSHGPDWSSDTIRTLALVMTNGILLNVLAITNGPAASRGTYVGTTRSNASSTLDWIFGGSASGGTAAVLALWNCYNRVTISAEVRDTGAAYTYSSATIRQARASAGNQVSFVRGLQEDAMGASYGTEVSTVAVVGANAMWSTNVDSTSAHGTTPNRVYNISAGGGTAFAHHNFATYFPGVGWHFIAAVEQGDGTNGNTFANRVNLQVLSVTLRA